VILLNLCIPLVNAHDPSLVLKVFKKFIHDNLMFNLKHFGFKITRFINDDLYSHKAEHNNTTKHKKNK